MQHQNFTEVVATLAIMYERIPRQHQPRTEDLILRILSGLADHVLTAELDDALLDLINRLRAADRADTAHAVALAHQKMQRTIGVLHSRSTRAGAD